MNAYIEVPWLYGKAVEAKNKGNFKEAANLFLQCFEVYENAELHQFDEELKNKGESALTMYNEIVSNYLDGEEFDNIVYGV